jgi:hypothetical protein
VSREENLLRVRQRLLNGDFMMRLALAAMALPAFSMAQGFSFVVGNPVASQDFRFKMAAFVFRTAGCPSPTTPQISASAEGIVAGQRRSIALKVISGTKPGVYAVTQSWPAEGQWVVNLKGKCATADAGALVAVGPTGFIRESTRFFSHAPTNSEIEMAFKKSSPGDRK